MNTIRLLSDGIDTVCRWALIALLAVILLVIAGSILLRQLLGLHFIGSYDLSRILFIWGVFLGAGVAYKQELHTRFTIVATRLTPPGQIRLNILINGLCLVLLVILGYPSIQLAYSARIQTLPASDINAVWLYLPVTAGAFTMIVHALYLLFRDMHSLGGSDSPRGRQ